MKLEIEDVSLSIEGTLILDNLLGQFLISFFNNMMIRNFFIIYG